MLGCAVSLVLSGFGCEAVAADPGIIKIGLNYPETGPYAKQGLDQKRAAELAVEEINAAGGILGKKVHLVLRDTKSNAKVAKANAAEMYDVEGVPMILGGSSSAVAIATGEVALQKDRLFFATLSYSTETTGEYGHRHIFRECFDAYFAGKVMAEYLNKNFKGRKYFYITANYTWGWTTESVLRSFTDTKDTAKYPEVLAELGAKDFSVALRQARESGAEVLVLSLFGRDMEIAVKQAYDMGLKKSMQIIVPQMNEDMAQGAGPEAMEGIIGATPWMWSVPFTYKYPRGIAFVTKFEERYQRYPTTSGASAYVILHEYKAAVEQAKTFKTKAVMRALEGRKYTGLKDQQYWRSFDHQSIQTVYAVKIKPAKGVKKSKYGMDYFDIIATMKGDQAAVDFKEWSEIRDMVGMKPELEEYVTPQ
ncbi:MAG TPA: ABC transporter substrate-binding protein [Desulfuromonadales bacterium]|nr:ABC transporter substrate-binding protein [Desulfuromonadales bacterium]